VRGVTAPGVKFCGLTRVEDAREAARLGAAYVGAVLVPGTPRAVSPERARALGEAAGLPLVLVLVDPTPAEARDAASRAGAAVLQLHGGEDPQQVRSLREEGPWKVWKGVPVRDRAEALDAVRRFGPVVDGLLLDGWHPSLRGGAGVSFPWREVAEARGEIPSGVLFIAAGGLTPENVGEAASVLRPHVVDVSSGVESAPGLKDARRMKAFVEATRLPASVDP